MQIEPGVFVKTSQIIYEIKHLHIFNEEKNKNCCELSEDNL